MSENLSYFQSRIYTYFRLEQLDFFSQWTEILNFREHKKKTKY